MTMNSGLINSGLPTSGPVELPRDASASSVIAPDQGFFNDLNGELTDKGYINQALARDRRPSELARLFAESPDENILVF